MLPEIVLNYPAILVCVVIAMPLGFLWYGPLFGRAWAQQMGFNPDEKPDGMAKSMILYAVGSFLIIFVLAHGIEVWQPSSWNAGKNDAPWVYGLNSAVWTWVGFFLPLQLGRVAWEKRGWGLVGISGAFDLVRLLIFSMVLAYWQ